MLFEHLKYMIVSYRVCWITLLVFWHLHVILTRRVSLARERVRYLDLFEMNVAALVLRLVGASRHTSFIGLVGVTWLR